MFFRQPAMLRAMGSQIKPRRTLRRFSHSIWLRVLGFVWLFTASMLIAIGTGLGLLGVGGHLLVRLRPAASSNISYDPSTIASFAPIPFGLGCLLIAAFAWKSRRLGD
ncbi:MAG TPA: hypothetical protein VEQ36_16370 [Thermomicrobiales bacterium]|nr:hypothetical protein [Thermomicrobiales bacterium]